MIIRPEKNSDFLDIYKLVQTSFLTATVSNGKEQDFVDTLRAGSNYIPELALVAEENGKLIGHIMLTRMTVTGDSWLPAALLLAPISVYLEFRGRGVGTALINESFRLAVEMGYSSVFLVGDPRFYEKFGFRQADSFGIRHTPEAIPAANVMACELEAGSLDRASATVDFR